MSTKFKRVPLSKLVSPQRPIVYGIVQAGENIPGGVPYIRSTDVGETLKASDLLRTSAEIAARYARSVVSPGDIVFSLRGNIGESSIVPKELAGANLTQGTARISICADHSASFIRYALNQTEVHRRILAVAKGSTFHEITLEDLRNLEVPVPTLREQEKIANILSTWDEALGKIASLLNAKDRHYSGLLEAALKRDLHKMCKVRDVTLETGPRNRELGVQQVLSVTKARGFILPEDYFDKQVASADTSGYKIVKRGEFAYNPSRINVGSIARLDHWEEGIVSPVYVVFALNDRVHPDFFFHWLKSHEARSRIRRSAQGSVRDSVSFADFGSIRFPLPSKERQRVIATYLNAAQTEISILRQKRAALDKQKRGLMQVLLTGRKRVKTN